MLVNQMAAGNKQNIWSSLCYESAYKLPVYEHITAPSYHTTVPKYQSHILFAKRRRRRFRCGSAAAFYSILGVCK